MTITLCFKLMEVVLVERGAERTSELKVNNEFFQVNIFHWWSWEQRALFKHKEFVFATEKICLFELAVNIYMVMRE